MIINIKIENEHCNMFNKKVQIRYSTHSLFGDSVLPKKHIITGKCLDGERTPICFECEKNK